ncbi:hypothetical protein OIU79_005686 [Salix purpurea]|uniref:Uncharacterized protein n=2 Tax=Salix TaxID=40685 RepID=A0A9Q0TTI7_SALPP|nr:Aspartate/glutamate/uridylate kinase family protein [Salix suchowensis]KAJ6717561.1 hypothetical protein OIU79_005686 [Salix purpurea]
MAETENNKIVTQKDSSQKPSTLFSFFPKFELSVPFFSKPRPLVKEGPKIAVVTEGGENESGNQKPNFVSFPNTRSLAPSSIEVEVEESSGRTHNPAIIWQVYALGGFIVLKWIWARWQERNERAKKASSDGNQSNDEYQSPEDEE